jgi:hypothetical protein
MKKCQILRLNYLLDTSSDVTEIPMHWKALKAGANYVIIIGIIVFYGYIKSTDLCLRHAAPHTANS